jgi:hypothetical protein
MILFTVTKLPSIIVLGLLNNKQNMIYLFITTIIILILAGKLSDCINKQKRKNAVRRNNGQFARKIKIGGMEKGEFYL